MLRAKLKNLLPAGAVGGVLGLSLFVVPAAITGIGVGYNYGGSACTSANISAAPASPSETGTAIVLTASSTTCTHPEYQFYTQAPGGAWVAATAFLPWNGTSTATFNWSTNGLAPGVWGIGVWARESGAASGYQAYATATYTLTGSCMDPTLSASPASPQAAGTAVTFTAAASGCSNPQFRFWALVPGRSSWVMIQDYSATNTFSWKAANTAGSPLGTYQIGVWSREVGSTNSYDGYTIITFRLTSATTFCSSASISAAPASPQAAGTITLTASSTGCSGAVQYEFWMQPPGGTWQILQAFSTTTTATFNASTAAHGAWHLGVWAKAPGSTNSYDSYAIITYYVGV